MASRIPYMLNFVKKYPFLSCLILLLFTPPVFRLWLFFSPLLVSTALCVLALVSLEPHLAASEGHSKTQGGGRDQDWIIGLTSDYCHLGDEIAIKKFADSLNEKSRTELNLKFEDCGQESASNRSLADMHGKSQTTEGVSVREDAVVAGSNSNPSSAAFEDCLTVSHEESDLQLEDTTSVAADIQNQALLEVSFPLNDLNVAEEQHKGTSGVDVEVENKNDSQNRVERLIQPPMLNVGFEGKTPAEDEHKAAHGGESAAATRNPSTAYRIQLLEREELKRLPLENGPAEQRASQLLHDQEAAVALHGRRCMPRIKNGLGRTSTQETANKSPNYMQQQDDEPSSAASAMYGLATGFHSSFDPWECSIWGRDPIQEETSSFALAQTV